MSPEALDLFAGPGGWDEGARQIGLTDVDGLENDPHACATAEAAGHRRHQVDIAAAEPRDYADPGRLPLLIGSPPCPGFSSAGKGLGRKDLQLLTDAIAALAGGVPADLVLDAVLHRQHDDRSALTLEPLRWALALQPRAVALEQVPAVLPLWQACALALEARGYSVVTGLLHAEQYGVPQTRKRAVLLATTDGEAALPTPTHSRFYPTDPTRLDPGVAHWVTMAEALGHGMTERPYPTIASTRTTGGPDREKVGGSHARSVIYTELAAGRWRMTSGTRPRSSVREGHQPAATLAFGHDAASYTFVPADVDLSDLAAAKRAGLAVRISITEAAVLQTFRPDYPWQGTDTQQLRQIGNAVPPLLGAHALAAATGRALTSEVAA